MTDDWVFIVARRYEIWNGPCNVRGWSRSEPTYLNHFEEGSRKSASLLNRRKEKKEKSGVIRSIALLFQVAQYGRLGKKTLKNVYHIDQKVNWQLHVT